MTFARAFAVAGALGLASAACLSASGPEIVHGTAVDHGRALFEDPKASPSASNTFTCATCHRAEANDANDATARARIDPGAPLAGVTARKTFWGGQRVDLLASVNDCRAFFMDARVPWTADDEDARAMYAFLAQLAPASGAPASDAFPFTVVSNPVDLPAGDPKRGAIAYDLACKTCHGSVHDGSGRLASFIPSLPDQVVRSHAELSPVQLRLVFVTKARGGAFRGGGSMPPFSREVLADEDLAGILAYFAL
jgi:cytochrome c